MATEHVLVGAAAKIPVSSPASPIISFAPVIIPSPGRAAELRVRVTMPAGGGDGAPLPVILLSHGHGRSNWLSSLQGYAPLAEFWAKHGFAVLQPTHLTSRTLGVAAAAAAGDEMHWRSRPGDMSRILDHLDAVEAAVLDLLAGRRLDRGRVAVAGHSFGGMTASLLLGARNTDPRDGAVFDGREGRIRAGVVLAGTGNGGSGDLSESGRAMVPFYGMDFAAMAAPALVVGGDADVSPHLTARGADWHWDAYTHGPGPKDLLVVRGGRHGLGGVSGWDAAETQDESPEMLGMVQRMTWAYLRSQLYEGDESWERACEVLAGLKDLGFVESKR
ncbi:putative chlorophyllase multi-domain protein [Rosellinia necatrix]|uniref:Putative chlorophyllase multi-domain protein n=1 Tax=Rosellinia necatrix TaxID=77044 RepID=A0A1W2TIN5_ROSNE|nr:putative chlorophyllase multi-domain protein [Rosellinia necatrix]